MKKLLKQVGICVFFVGLFVGMQFAIQYAVGFGYVYYARFFLSPTSNSELSAKVNELLAGNIELLTIVSGCATILAVWIFSKIRKKKFVQECNLVSFNTKNLLPIALMTIGCDLVIRGCFSLLPETVMDSYITHMGDDGEAIILVLLSSAIVAPIVEELVFRSIVMLRLNKVMNIFLAVFLSTMVFGILHGDIVQSTYAVVLGLIMSFIAVRCASVLASIFFHLLFNIIGTLSITQYFIGDSQTSNIIAGIIGLFIVILTIIWVYKINERKPNIATAS